MSARDPGTEERILIAARTVFLHKGYYGARMQEIADEAGINKALLHYYFRSKDRLFEMIFMQAFARFVPVVENILGGPDPLPVKISSFVDHYIDLLRTNPYLPQFILNEITRDPDGLSRLFLASGLNPESYMQQVIRSLGPGMDSGSDFRHFMVNMLSMCIFPFVARPLLSRVMFGNDEAAYEHFLDERKKEVTSACLRMIGPSPVAPQ